MPRNNKRVTLKLPADIHRALKALSAETGLSMGRLVREAIRLLAGKPVHAFVLRRQTKRGSR